MKIFAILLMSFFVCWLAFLFFSARSIPQRQPVSQSASGPKVYLASASKSGILVSIYLIDSMVYDIYFLYDSLYLDTPFTCCRCCCLFLPARIICRILRRGLLARFCVWCCFPFFFFFLPVEYPPFSDRFSLRGFIPVFSCGGLFKFL